MGLYDAPLFCGCFRLQCDPKSYGLSRGEGCNGGSPPGPLPESHPAFLCPDGPHHHSFRDLPSDHRHLQPAPDDRHDAEAGRPGPDPAVWRPDRHHEHGTQAWRRPACHAAVYGAYHLADPAQRNPHVQCHPEKGGPDDPGGPGKCHRYPYHQSLIKDRL